MWIYNEKEIDESLLEALIEADEEDEDDEWPDGGRENF